MDTTDAVADRSIARCHAAGLVGEQAAGDVADAAELHLALRGLDLGDGSGTAPGGHQGAVQLLHQCLQGDVRVMAEKHLARLLAGSAGGMAMTQAVADQHAVAEHGPGVAAEGLAGVGRAHGAHLQGASGRALAQVEAGLHHGTETRLGEQVEAIGHALDGTEAGAHGAGGGVVVAQALGHVGHAGTTVHCGDFEAGFVAAEQQLALAGVVDQVAGHFLHHHGEATEQGFIAGQLAGVAHHGAAHGIHMGAVGHLEQQVAAGDHFHFHSSTRVPSPGRVSMANSSTRRRAPLRPRPSPPPEV